MTRLDTIRTKDFAQILEIMARNGHTFQNMLDGGAGAGHTATKMLKYLEPEGSILAFEPFPGNHRFFEGLDSRIKLIKKALAAENAEMGFLVSSTVSEGSSWGKRGMVGYSSVGRLVPDIVQDSSNSYIVQATRGSEELHRHGVENVNFIKLDIQGAELAALHGLESTLPSVSLMWVECTRIAGLITFLTDHGFDLFDTEYMFMEANMDTIGNEFVLTRTAENSTGKTVSFGYRVADWPDYEVRFKFHKKHSGMIQTDLVAVPKSARATLASLITTHVS